MLTSEDFAERYKTMSNAELLDIVERPAGYQLIALQAAKAELAARQLSDQDIAEARQVLRNNQLQKEKQHEKINLVKTKINDAGNLLYDNLQPDERPPSSQKKIIVICIAFFGLTIYEIASNYGAIIYLFSGHENSGLDYTVYVFPSLVLLCGTILFSLRKTSGWVILGLYCGISLIFALWGLYYAVKFQFTETHFFFYRPSIVSPILSLIFYGGILFVFCKPDIKEIYKIDRQNMISTLVAGGIFGIVMIWAIAHM